MVAHADQVDGIDVLASWKLAERGFMGDVSRSSLAPPAQKLCKRAAAENVLGINDARAWFRCRCARVLYINGIRNANLYFDIHRVYTSRECLVY